MTPKALEGRVAVVTGSSRGIGRALALRLAREGARGRHRQKTERLPGSIHSVVEEVRALGGDVGWGRSIEKTSGRFDAHLFVGRKGC